jgi:dTDP-D-glucose 4,6-dehydratase
MDAWRQGDQRYYVSDTSKFRQATGWRPETNARDGIAKLHRWLEESGCTSLQKPSAHERTRISAVRAPVVHPTRAAASATTST